MLERLLHQAIEKIKVGDNAQARASLVKILKADRHQEQAWLWLAQTDITIEDKIKSLKQVLRINPNNERAKQELAKLQGQGERSRSTRKVKLATGNRRLIAFLIDDIVLQIIIVPFLFCAVFPHANEGNISPIYPRSMLIVYLIPACYFVWSWVMWSGQSLGKQVVKIKIINADGSPIFWHTAILRYLGYLIGKFSFGTGFFWIQFDPQRQGWHDKIAGTYVVNEDTFFSPTEPVTFVSTDSGTSPTGVIVLTSLILLCAVMTVLGVII